MKDQSQYEVDYARIEKAIRYLNEKVGEQPGLEEVAAHVGVSPYHFQRMFSRWAGVSPKQFLSLLTLNHAKGILERTSLTLLETALDTGLSGTSRLHDLFVKFEAMTPGEYRRSGQDVEIRFGFHATPFGRAVICVTDRGICGLSFTEPENQIQALELQKNRWPLSSFRHDAPGTGEYIRRVFFSKGEANRLNTVNCLTMGSPFQLKVWEALLTLRPGFTCSYGDVAKAVGTPAAARAAANAVAANRIGYLIPCHRVIRESGAIGGYRWGISRKQAMLARESAQKKAPRQDDGGL